MSLWRRFEYMYASAGRLLDFGGCYNHVYLQRRLEVPGYLRDRQTFAADMNALQRDVDSAAERLGQAYGS